MTNGKAKKLTISAQKFIRALLNGKSQRDAYYIGYPHSKKWKTSSVDCEASKLFNRPDIQHRYQELLHDLQSKEQSRTQWTREESIKTLRTVIDRNTTELQRIDEAYIQELELIEEEIKVNPMNAGLLTTKIIDRLKERRISRVHNAGIIDAVSELNKMQGFGEETINVNGTVIFSGEDELED